MCSSTAQRCVEHRFGGLLKQTHCPRVARFLFKTALWYLLNDAQGASTTMICSLENVRCKNCGQPGSLYVLFMELA